MCRMFAAIGKGIPARDLLLQFQQLAIEGKRLKPNTKGHHDGWGIVGKSISDPDFHYFGRSALDAGEDPEYEDSIQAISNNYSGIILAHLRQASEGLPKDSKEMNHPFIKNGLTFEHNGTVFFEANSKISDSTQLFDLLLEKSPTLDKDGIFQGMQAVSTYLDEKMIMSVSHSCIIGSQKGIWAYRTFIYDKYAEVLNIHALDQGSYKILCQEPLTKGNWTELKQDEMRYINLNDLNEESVVIHRTYKERGVLPCKL
jgi:predicted glutamine amidotransferase